MLSALVRIEIVRHGGFAGIARRGCVELEDAPEDERDAAAKAVGELRRAAAGTPPGPGHPDAFIYTVEVIERDRREELTVPEHAVPDDVRPFLEGVLRGA
jgi:hypothetical protein